MIGQTISSRRILGRGLGEVKVLVEGGEKRLVTKRVCSAALVLRGELEASASEA